jgi:putative spermidine/putrescine transport system permease protein
MSGEAGSAFVSSADDIPLAVKMRRARRKKELEAFGLMLPLLAFMLVFFIFPILTMLVRSVENKEVVSLLPQTMAAMSDWNGTGVPDEPVFAALAADLRNDYRNKTAQRLAVRLNFEIADFRTLILKTSRAVGKMISGPYRDQFAQLDERWNEPRYWAVLWQNRSQFTDYYYLTALDLERNTEHKLQRIAPDQRIYIPIFIRTVWISLLVTLLCFLLGYPVAFFLARQPVGRANILMFFVLVPFWTSLLVRTIGWVVLLQERGVLNDFLLWLGLTTHRYQLIYNRTGLLIAMVHVLLPFMILPLFSVMRTIDTNYVRAARSLGANPLIAFLTVYFPQSMPGVSAGCFLVFILAIGYYITPELVGGPGDQMISHFIAYYIDFLINWGQATALATILLVVVVTLCAFSFRFLRLTEL